MFVDANTVASSTTFHADVCVVGAGPAGIVLCLELAQSGLQVLLIESGSTAFDPAAQKLGEATVANPARHAPLAHATRRQFGGTSTLWGGRCVPLDPVDFELRDYLPDSGWPISYREMADHYPKACAYAGCGPADFASPSALSGRQTTIVPGLPDGAVTSSSLERWGSPTDFGQRYRQDVARHPRITCLLNATCTSIEFVDNPASVAALGLRAPGGNRLSARGHMYVLAGGGIATTRLLLASNRVHPAGIGNASGKLGRFYMGHLSGKIADLRFSTPPERTIFGFERDPLGSYCRKRFVISGKPQADHRLLNCALWLDNPQLADPHHRSGILSLAALALGTPALGRRLAPEAIVAAAVGEAGGFPRMPHLLNVMRDLPSVMTFAPAFVYKRYFSPRRVPGFFVRNSRNAYALHYHAEQIPNEQSQIRLGPDADTFGMRLPVIDLQFSNADAESVVRTHQLLDSHLRAHGCGQLLYRFVDPHAAVLAQARDGFHQIGTTRMSGDPRHGVVDANCRVHGLDNLFVSSSSVFPTSGQANPTLSIIALSIRLARHLATVVD
jgi:choline dehydrogenase-like flavoprotein